MHEALARMAFEKDVAHLSDVFLRTNKWVVNERSFPILDVTFLGSPGLRVRLRCDEWNEKPPKATLHEPSGEPLPKEKTGFGCFNSSDPTCGTPGPFICMVGFHEFHTHSSHLTEYWDTYKAQSGYGLAGLLHQVCRHWRQHAGHSY